MRNQNGRYFEKFKIVNAWVVCVALGFGYCLPGWGEDLCTPGQAMTECKDLGEIESCPYGSYKTTCNYTGNALGERCICCPTGFHGGGQQVDGINNCRLNTSCEDGILCFLTYGGLSGCVSLSGATQNKHLEKLDGSVTCVDNHKDCNQFDLAGNYQLGWADGIWEKQDQYESASWDTNNGTWNVNNCLLQKNNLNINRYERNCTGNVWRSGASISGNAVSGFKINYSDGTNWYYCTHCDAGKTPQIFDVDEAQMSYGCLRYESGGQYLACACTDVEVGYYSDGCNWTYPLDPLNPSGAAVCHQPCPANMTTLDSGADSINSCVPNGQPYCDQTGCFTLGTDASVCP